MLATMPNPAANASVTPSPGNCQYAAKKAVTKIITENSIHGRVNVFHASGPKHTYGSAAAIAVPVNVVPTRTGRRTDRAVMVASDLDTYDEGRPAKGSGPP